MGGGFGSAISSVPSLAGIGCPHPPLGPQAPTPLPPAGYIRRHPQDGYWDPPPAAQQNVSVADCATKCDAAADACDAFEVYIHFPPDRGDCYPMGTAGKTFVPLGGGSRTYLKHTSKGAPAAAARGCVGAGGGCRGAERARGGAPQTRLQRVAEMAGAQSRGAGSASADADVARAEASTFQRAWVLLLGAAGAHGGVASFGFDLVDIGREVIAANFSATLSEYDAAFGRRDAATAAVLAKRMLATIDDYDALLATDANFLLGRWLAWARSWGDGEAAKKLLEYGARNQLTLWGPSGQINDCERRAVPTPLAPPPLIAYFFALALK